MIFQRTPRAPIPDVFANRADIQALVGSGFNSLPKASFLLLEIADPARARHWLRGVLNAGLVSNVADIDGAQPTETVSIAMTHAGLLRAGVQPSQTHPFPSTFAIGMGDADHAKRLGDSTQAAGWRWSDVPIALALEASVVHWLLACYWAHGAAPAHPLLQVAALTAAGFTLMEIPADPGFIQPDGSAIEPFGFRDGIAQPVIDGLRKGQSRRHREIKASKRAAARDHVIAPGEFVLGYPNEYGELGYAPEATGHVSPSPLNRPQFAQNGSYLAVRQIRQDVRALFAFEAALPALANLTAPTLIEKMIGRYRDGRPVGLPHRQPKDIDDFRYAMYDGQGFGCPRGAHVRRANPRDLMGMHSIDDRPDTRLHRLLRRGRSYRFADGEQGMFFMALNADLDRQFAFVQSQWIQQDDFASLAEESDPLLGTADRNFTVQCPLLSQRYTTLPDFTEVVGGGYFFLPGLRALREIAA